MSCVINIASWVPLFKSGAQVTHTHTHTQPLRQLDVQREADISIFNHGEYTTRYNKDGLRRIQTSAAKGQQISTLPHQPFQDYSNSLNLLRPWIEHGASRSSVLRSPNWAIEAALHPVLGWSCYQPNSHRPWMSCQIFHIFIGACARSNKPAIQSVHNEAAHLNHKAPTLWDQILWELQNNDAILVCLLLITLHAFAMTAEGSSMW